MNRRPECSTRVQLTIELADGCPLPVLMDARSIQFVGHHARLPALGPVGAMLRFRLLPA